MNNSSESLSHNDQYDRMRSKKGFSHIFIEKAVMDHPKTKQILSRVSTTYKNDNAEELVSLIDSYKDIFYDNNSSFGRDRVLILSAAGDTRVFPGAPVCQDFDERYFYYASSAKNCIYDCEYCYLKGMYPSSHLVIDVDLTGVFSEVEKLIEAHPVYLCISYDTDLLALESITGSLHEWMDFARNKKELRIECRTKCARTDLWEDLTPDEDFIFAFTLSPQEVIKTYEHGTPSLEARLRSIRQAMAYGHPVRLCFDPMIYIPEWKKRYEEMTDSLAETIDLNSIRDISIGSFRISASYLKRMRRLLPDSTVVQFPFELENGVYQYPGYLKDEMQSFLREKLSQWIPDNKIYDI